MIEYRGDKKEWEEGTTQEETFRVMKIYIFLIVVMVSSMYKYVKTYHIVHFKYMQFIIGPLYLNKAIDNKWITFITQYIS